MVSIPHIIFVYKTSALKALKEILFIFLPIKTTSNKVELNQTYSYLIKHFMAIVKVAPESFFGPKHGASFKNITKQNKYGSSIQSHDSYQKRYVKDTYPHYWLWEFQQQHPTYF